MAAKWQSAEISHSSKYITNKIHAISKEMKYYVEIYVLQHYISRNFSIIYHRLMGNITNCFSAINDSCANVQSFQKRRHYQTV